MAALRARRRCCSEKPAATSLQDRTQKVSGQKVQTCPQKIRKMTIVIEGAIVDPRSLPIVQYQDHEADSDLGQCLSLSPQTKSKLRLNWVYPVFPARPRFLHEQAKIRL